MKNLYILPALVLASLFLVSCSSDSDDDPVTPPPNNTTLTYTNTVKSIIDSNCNSCHGSPTSNNAPMSLITFSQVKEAVLNRNLIGRIEDGTMPPNGTLSSTQIKAIKDWQTVGFLE